MLGDQHPSADHRPLSFEVAGIFVAVVDIVVDLASDWTNDVVVFAEDVADTTRGFVTSHLALVDRCHAPVGLPLSGWWAFPAAWAGSRQIHHAL